MCAIEPGFPEKETPPTTNKLIFSNMLNLLFLLAALFLQVRKSSFLFDFFSGVETEVLSKSRLGMRALAMSEKFDFMTLFTVSPRP